MAKQQQPQPTGAIGKSSISDAELSTVININAAKKKDPALEAVQSKADAVRNSEISLA